MIPIRKALETLAKLADTVKELELKQALSELQSAMISAFDSYSELMEKNVKLKEENGELKDQIKKYRDWDTEKQNYGQYYESGSLFYIRKGADLQNQPREKRELFCPHCFEVRCAPYHLQPSVKEHRNIYCPACKNEFRGWL